MNGLYLAEEGDEFFSVFRDNGVIKNVGGVFRDSEGIWHADRTAKRKMTDHEREWCLAEAIRMTPISSVVFRDSRLTSDQWESLRGELERTIS